MLLDIQRGELEAARTTLDPWLRRVPSHLAQLAIQIGQATDDEALLLLCRSESNQQFGAKWPTSPAASTLDRTKYADGNRAITIRKSFPQLNQYRVSAHSLNKDPGMLLAFGLG